MIEYAIAPDPNQVFEVSPMGVTYEFTLATFRGMVYATIRDAEGNVLYGSLRCTDGGWLIPRGGLSIGGNFRIETPSGQYPDADAFAEGAKLLFLTDAEIAEGA